MIHDDVQKFSNAALAKANLAQNNFFKYFLRAVMAGFFIAVAMIYNNVVGNLFWSNAETSDPALGKFLAALVFSIAVLLIVMVGGELFTGNNLVMAMGLYDKKVTGAQVGRVWIISWIGNFVGCLIFSLIFYLGGASGTKDYFASFIESKLAKPPVQMFFQAILCNFFVCLAVACGVKLTTEVGKFLMISICISGFVISGFEHCIANMAIFTTAFCLNPSLPLGSIILNLVIVTIGNMVGGALLLAWPLRKMSADQ